MNVTQLTRALIVVCTSVIAFTGCGDDQHAQLSIAAADGGDDPQYLGLATPNPGLQVRDLGTEIASGEDVEYCEVAQIPPDQPHSLYVTRFELGNAPSSHHLIISAITPSSVAEDKVAALGIGQRVPCISAESAFGADGVVRLAGSQSPYSDQPMVAGVGRELHAGQYLVFDYHYLNSTDATVDARSAINLHTAPEAAIQNLASEFGFRNYTLAIAPDASGSYTAECHFKHDLMLGSITRHTHRWGTNFTVWFAGGDRDAEQIWTSDDWQHANDYAFDAPVLMHAGEGLRFRCDFQNTTDHTLRFGTSATDEMCILFGVVWGTEPGRDPDIKPYCEIVWRDADDVGHPADEAGGFPAADDKSAKSCGGLLGDKDACAQCRCQACGTPFMQCMGESDCAAVLSCYGGCVAGQDCNALCEPTIDAHSSGVGSFVQTSQCFSNRCDSVCQ